MLFLEINMERILLQGRRQFVDNVRIDEDWALAAKIYDIGPQMNRETIFFGDGILWASIAL